MKVILTGFMGSGKTTLLEQWEASFPGEALDLDHWISSTLGIDPNSLGDWIKRNGLDAFRLLETESLKELLGRKGNLLLSLGGGAFSHSNRDLINKSLHSVTIWLKAPPEVLWKRVEADKNRPLASEGFEKFKKLYLSRVSDYKQANFCIESSEKFPSYEAWFMEHPEVSELMDE